MSTRIDPSEHWIGPAHSRPPAPTSTAVEIEIALGWGEEFDLVAATLSEAPPGMDDYSSTKSSVTSSNAA